MKIIHKNILDIDSGIICHACNCQNKFGKGLAKSIKEKFPNVYQEFLKFGSVVKSPLDRLGMIQEVYIDDDLSIVNCFTQLYYGDASKTLVDYNSYDSWTKVSEKISKIRGERVVYFPYNVGCGLAGGNFEMISKRIIQNIPDVVFCKI